MWEFIMRLFEINQYLDQFPPFNANQKLPTDELLDIAGYAILVPWQNTMHLHAFDPLAHNEDEFIEFCQRCEFIEWPPQTWSESNNDGNGQACAQGHMEQYDSANQKHLAKHKNPEALEDGKPKWCEYHQSTKHNMGACWDVLNQVATMCCGFNPVGVLQTNPLKSVRSHFIQLRLLSLWHHPRKLPEKSSIGLNL